MADFFGHAQPGTWTVSSVIDPRWDGSGRVDDLVITAGHPQEVQDFVKMKEEELGERPADLFLEMKKD